MGSIKLAPTLTEVDYIPKEIRERVGEILLTASIIQHQLSDLFANIAGLQPSIFTYLGHDIDTSKMITAIKRLAKSDDCPIAVDAELIAALNKCGDVLRKRNSVAHGSMAFVDGTLFRYQLEGGEKPHRLVQGLNQAYFDALLAEAKAALWALRVQGAAISKRRAIGQ